MNWERLIFILLSMLLYSCSDDSTNYSGRNKTNPTAGDSNGIVKDSGPNAQGGPPSGGPPNGSAAALSLTDVCGQTVYPLAKQFCGSCHGTAIEPKFATDDMQASCNLLLESQKVNLIKPSISALVTKLGKLRHSCWTDCAADASAMETKIKEWADHKDVQSYVQGLVAELAKVPKTKEFLAGQAVELDFVEGLEGITPVTSGNFTLSGNFNKAVAAESSSGEYVFTPQNANGCNANAANSTNFGIASFEIKEAGDYFLFHSVASASNANNSLHFTIDNNAPINSATVVTGDENTYMWSRATLNNQLNQIAPAITLAAGTHQLRVACRDVNTRLDAVVFTQNPNFTGVNLKNLSNAKLITLDIAPLCGVPDAKFEIFVKELGDSYQFTSPKVKSSVALEVGSIVPYRNGLTSKSWKTWEQSSAQVPANSDIPVAQGALILEKELGIEADSFEFNIGLCKPL